MRNDTPLDPGEITLTVRDQLRRMGVFLKAYIWPQWRSLECSRCYMTLTARSGVHMTRLVGKHRREYHQ